MDASGSLTTQMFSAIKLTVANTIANMKLSNNDVRVRGIVTFDDNVQEVAEDINDKVLLRELILGAVHTKGMTKIDLAITRLTEYLLSGLLQFVYFIDIIKDSACFIVFMNCGGFLWSCSQMVFFFAITVMSLENRFEFNTFVNKGLSFYVKKML